MRPDRTKRRAVSLRDPGQRRARTRAWHVRTGTLLAAITACFWLGAVVPRAHAQQAPVAPPLILPSPANADSALSHELGRIEGAPLSLGDAIHAAVTGGSLAQRTAAATLAAARGTHTRENGAFDPNLFLNTDRTHDEQPSASPFAGAPVVETDQTVGTGGARWTLPFGTQLEAALDGSKTETNSTFASVNPQFDANGHISILQPLLNGFGPGTGSEAKATGREAEAAKARYDDVVLGVQALVEETYWDLYAAERDLAVQRAIRNQAAAFVDQAELRMRAGLVGPNDVAQAKAFLAEQEQTVLDREEGLDQTSDLLANQIGQRPPQGLPRYRPVDAPPSEYPIEPEDSVVAIAAHENRELHAREQELSAAHARVQGAKWNSYPTLNLLGSLGGRGLSGTGHTVIFGTDTLVTNLSGDFGDAFSQVTSRDFPNWSVGLQFNFPIFLRSGRGELERLRGVEEEARSNYDTQLRTLEDQVRTAHRALVRASRRLDAARAGVDASREQVRIGVLQYNSGRTTAFELVRLGADLATAQERYSAALVRTARAAAALRFLTAGVYPAMALNEGSPR